MSQDATGFAAALKEVWTEDVIEEQIYQGNPLLEALERQPPITEVGNKAVVAVHTGRSGGYSAVPRTGSENLNPAGKQSISKAEYEYTHHWFQIGLETAIIDESSKSPLAVAQALEVEMKGSTDDIRKQLTRQAYLDGTAKIAQCGVTSNSKTLVLANVAAGGYGHDAIERGWLYPELPVDIGTEASEAEAGDGLEVTAVNESETAPTLTLSGAVTTTAADYVSIAGARSGATSYEMSGLSQLVAETGVVGNIDPAVTPTWKSSVDSTTRTLSLQSLYTRQRKVFQKTGADPDWALTSAKQYEALYNLLQASIRFNGDGNLGAGDMKGLNLGGTLIERQVDCPNRAFYLLTKRDLFVVRTEGPRWASEKYGGTSEPVQYVPGTTKVSGGLNYRMQLALKRRDSHSALTNLE